MKLLMLFLGSANATMVVLDILAGTVTGWTYFGAVIATALFVLAGMEDEDE